MNGIIPHDLPFPDFTPKTRCAVLHTAVKMWSYFSEHDNIMISVSGGSDSDCIVHLVCMFSVCRTFLQICFRQERKNA